MDVEITINKVEITADSVEEDVELLETSQESPGLDVETPCDNETINEQEEIILEKDIKLNILKKVNDVIVSQFSTKLLTIFIDHDQNPLLNVLSMKCDPMFWVDQGLLHMNILVLNDSTIQIVLLTPNRNIVETYQCTSDSEVSSILNCVIERQDLPCHGFESQDHIYNQILQRVRKSDIDGTLIEKFNGKIIFRSRSCQYTYQGERKDLFRSLEMEISTSFVGIFQFMDPIFPFL